MRKKLLFVILWLISFSLSGKIISDNFQFDIDTLRFFTLKNEKLLFIFNSSEYILSENNIEINKLNPIEGVYYKTLTNRFFENINDSLGNIYFVRRDLGEVFKYENNSFERMDKSSHIKTSKGSFKFFHKGNILSFFGTHENTSSNIILDFNFDSKEWDKITPSSLSEVPYPRSNAFFKNIGDTIHYFGGQTNSHYNDKKTRSLRDYFIFIIPEKVHKKIGDLIPKELFVKSWNGASIEVDNSRSLFFNQKDVILVDFKNFTYQSKSIQSVFGCEHESFNSSFITSTDKKLYYLIDEKLNNEYALKSIDLINIVEQFNNPTLLIDSSTYRVKDLLKIILTAFTIFLACFVAYALFRLNKLKGFKKQNILKQSNYITFNKTIVNLSFEQSSVLDLLIENVKVKLSDFFELPCFLEYSDTYKKIYVPKILKELEFKLQIISNNKGKKVFLEKSNNKFDKRILEYRLKVKILPYKGWFFYIFSS